MTTSIYSTSSGAVRSLQLVAIDDQQVISEGPLLYSYDENVIAM